MPTSPPPNPPSGAPPWLAQSAEQALQHLASEREGLNADEVEHRQRLHGANRLPEPPAAGLFARLLRQFNSLLLYVLMAAALVTALIGHWVDAFLIGAVVLVNALIGFVQEGKAEKALQAIRHLLSPHAVVLRDGHQHDVDAAELVPGDIVLLASGDSLPAGVVELRADQRAVPMRRFGHAPHAGDAGIVVHTELLREALAFGADVAGFGNDHADTTARDTFDMGHLAVVRRAVRVRPVADDGGHHEAVLGRQPADAAGGEKQRECGHGGASVEQSSHVSTGAQRGLDPAQKTGVLGDARSSGRVRCCLSNTCLGSTGLRRRGRACRCALLLLRLVAPMRCRQWRAKRESGASLWHRFDRQPPAEHTRGQLSADRQS